MSTDYKAMLDSTSNHQPTVSNPVEAVVSGELQYSRVARAKFLELFMRSDCIGIIDSSSDAVVLSYPTSDCIIDKFGKCTWIGGK